MFHHHTITQQAKSFAELAEHYLQHEFNILGSGWVKLHHGMQTQGFEGHNYSDLDVTYQKALVSLSANKKAKAEELLKLSQNLRANFTPLDWHIDLKSGFRSELIHHTKLTYGNVPGVDMKTSADLNRLYHLPVLALAWKATGNREYFNEALAQFLDWYGQNPFEIGPAWRANMNVAIRAANLCVLSSIVENDIDSKNSAHTTFRDILSSSLHEHRCYISRYLEFPEGHYHPNHYIANLAGLLMVSTWLGENDSDAAAWRNIALREMKHEFNRQILDDGFDYEAATSYHALVLEMLFYSLTLTAKMEEATNPSEIRDWIEKHLGIESLQKLEAMFRALRAIIPPNGLIPLVGDNDSGRFLYLEAPNHDSRDWRFLCCLGAVLFETPELAAGFSDEAFLATRLLFGHKATIITDKENSPQSTAFREVGLYVMRSRQAYCLISAGPIGTAGSGGHAHCDKLALTLSIDNWEFLVDPGIYVYTASKEWRDAFRSTAMHNTLRLGGQEQNRPNPDSPWWGCMEDTHCHCTHWEVSAKNVVFEGEHHGYERLKASVLHRRHIMLGKSENILRVKDTLISTDDDLLPEARWTFMLHPSCTVTVEGRRAEIKNGPITLTLETSQDGLTVENGWFAPDYGIKLPTKTLVLATPIPPQETTFVFQWQR